MALESLDIKNLEPSYVAGLSPDSSDFLKIKTAFYSKLRQAYEDGRVSEKEVEDFKRSRVFEDPTRLAVLLNIRKNDSP